MIDCCIVGGGIIGLSIARELAGRGLAVRVLTRERRRDTASWAAAGIFPPAPDDPRAAPNDRLTAWSDRLHRAWARELLEDLGLKVEVRQIGTRQSKVVTNVSPKVGDRVKRGSTVTISVS